MLDSIPADLPLSEARDALEQAARNLTGLEDLGPDDYREGLDVFLRSCEEEADLSDIGRLSALGIALLSLAGRLESEAGWAAQPEIRDLSLESPVVIVGLPRTGTTVLHKILAMLPSLQAPELWLAQHPMPRPPRAKWSEHEAYRSCEEMLRVQQASSPDMVEIHEMRADEPDECWNLLRQSFATVTFECTFAVPGYSAWWAGCDMRPAYARWADNLRLIGSNDPAKRWILKDPSHLFAPDVLLETVPDATIVMTHRDPARLIPSVCSLAATARRVNDRNPDMRQLGRDQLELWSRGIERLMAVRERQPERFVDIHFRDFLADPLAAASKIADHAGIDLSDTSRTKARRWLESRPAKGHRYDAESFGLEDAAIRERFASYIDRFDIQIE